MPNKFNIKKTSIAHGVTILFLSRLNLYEFSKNANSIKIEV